MSQRFQSFDLTLRNLKSYNMKRTPPALTIPTKASLDGYLSSASPVSSIPTIDSLPMTPDDYDPLSVPQTASRLTFAALWDPLDGMMTFSGTTLLSDGRPDSLSDLFQDDQTEKELPSLPIVPVIQTPTPRRAFKIPNRPPPPPPRIEPIKDEWQQTPAKRCITSSRDAPRPDLPTPQSTLTFAAVWDPEQGMSTFTGPRLFENSVPAPTSSSYPANYHTRYFLPPTPQFDKRQQVASSTLDGFSSQSRPFDTYHHWLADRQACRAGRPSLDDEGFFDNYDSLHPDCEPHLPSRFSTTTTSTSNYINIDFPNEDEYSALPMLPPPVPPKTPPRARSSDSGHTPTPTISPPFALVPHTRSSTLPRSASSSTLKFASLSRSKSSPGSSRKAPSAFRQPSDSGSPTSPRPRLPSILGKFRLNSEATDDGWVKIDIMPVITDTLIRA